MDYNSKIEKLKEIRQLIKKKKIIFDENMEIFGLQELNKLFSEKNYDDKKSSGDDEIKGFPFQGVIKQLNYKIALKIVPYSDDFPRKEHPCYLENLLLRELTDKLVYTYRTPHLTGYLGTQKISNNCKAIKKLKLKKLRLLKSDASIKNKSNMIISDFVMGGSLRTWVWNKEDQGQPLDTREWYTFIFSILYTLEIFQKEYKLTHNDCHYDNILIDTNVKSGGYFVYHLYNKIYYIKNKGYIPKLWDFEFSMVYSNKMKDVYPNKFVIGDNQYDYKNHCAVKLDDQSEDDMPYSFNPYYDVHFFLTTLLDLPITEEVYDKINTLYPDELIPEESDEEYSDESDYQSYSSNDTDNKNEDNKKDKKTNDQESQEEYSNEEDQEEYSNEEDDEEDNEKEDEESQYKSQSDSILNEEESDKIGKYLSHGRMINGCLDNIDTKLPTPLSLISSGLFDFMLKKPSDYSEKLALHFYAQI